MKIGLFTLSEEIFYCLGPLLLAVIASLFLLVLRGGLSKACQQMLKLDEKQKKLARNTSQGETGNHELETLDQEAERLSQEINGTKKFIVFNYCVVLISVSFSLFSIVRFYEAARLSELQASLFVAALLFFLGGSFLLFVEIKNAWKSSVSRRSHS